MTGSGWGLAVGGVGRVVRRRGYTAVVAVAALALVAGLSAPLEAQADEPGPLTLGEKLGRIPDLDSPDVEATVDPQVPEGDFEEAVEEAEEPDPAVGGGELPATESEPEERPSLEGLSSADVVARDEMSTTYDVGDGRRVTEVSATPINVEAAPGRFVEASPLLLAEDSGGWAAGQHPLSPELADRADADSTVSVERGGYEVKFGLEGSRSVEGERDPLLGWSGLNEQAVEYENVLGSSDARFVVGVSSVKETLSVPSRPSRDSWTWNIQAPGLQLRLSELGAVEFVSGAGEVVMHIPTPAVWDSSGEPGKREPEVVNPEVSLTPKGDGDWALTVKVSRAWLDAPDRVYPVIVDPAIEAGSHYMHSRKSDGTVRTDAQLVGNTREGHVNRYWRTFRGFDLSFWANKQIIGTDVEVKSLSTNDAAASGGYVWHATCLERFDCLGQFLGAYSAISDRGTRGWLDRDSTQFFVNLRNVGDYGPVLAISGEEGGRYTFRHVDARLVIEWKEYPAPSPASTSTQSDGAVGTTPTPVLRNGGQTPEGAASSWSRFQISVDPNFGSLVHDSGFFAGNDFLVPEGLLAGSTKYYWRVGMVDSQNGLWGQSTERWSGAASFTTRAVVPTPAMSSASPGVPQTDPGAGPVVTTLTPTLQVDAYTGSEGVVPGQPVTYEFRIATGLDGRNGTVVSSGLLSPDAQGKVSWPVPAGTLQNGGTYTWRVETFNGQDRNARPSWVMKFRTDLRLGSSGPSPFDSAGPASVNLANGNVAMNFTSPTVQALGGPMGLSFSYNSQETKDSYRGLRAEFFDARDVGGNPPTSAQGYTFAGKSPLLSRVDSSVSFNWSDGPPAPAVPADHFLGRWTGYLHLPADVDGSEVTFGFRHDDGARIFVNDATEPTFARWDSGPSVLDWNASATKIDGRVAKIRVESYESTALAETELWVKYKANGQDKEHVVPPDWFSWRPQILPEGWSSSAPLTGDVTSLVKAQVTDSSVILTDESGSVTTFAKKSDGGYAAPADEYGQVALDAAGRVTYLDEDGTQVVFNAAGRVESATSVADAGKPAAPKPFYVGELVTALVDPLSYDGAGGSVADYGRAVLFQYQGLGGVNCPSFAGYSAPPAGALCRIEYPKDPRQSGSASASPPETNLLYNAQGQLVFILDPGTEMTQFGYDANGRINQIRDAAAIDRILAGGAAGADITYLAYDAAGRATSVVLPAPDGTSESARPAKTFTYEQQPSRAGRTFVDDAGVPVPGGHNATVTYDDMWRETSTTSAMGLTSSKQWHPVKDMVLSTTDPWGMKSTTIYDPWTDRAIAAYGPGPSWCYGADGTQFERTPVLCGDYVAASQTTYDANLRGLNASFYSNPNVAGAPVATTLGIAPGGDGSINRVWGNDAPAAGVPADNWSLRMSGRITFPQAGEYRLRTYADDGARVWVDDVLVAQRWPGGAAAWSTDMAVVQAKAGESKRIRIDYFDAASTASLGLNWVTPGASAPVMVPGSVLRPDYGLVTSTTTLDSAATQTGGISNAQVPSSTSSVGYEHPWLGAQTSSTESDGTRSLTTRTGFEQPGAAGWLRRTSKRLPAQVANGEQGATFAYWPDSSNPPQAVQTICGAKTDQQYGMSKSATGAAVFTGGNGADERAVVTEYVYDVWGRVAGTKQSGDGAEWVCTTYDARGRVAMQKVEGEVGRTVEMSYSATSAGLKVTTTDTVMSAASNSSKIETVSDLLGREVSYTDMWGAVTTTTYVPRTARVSSVETVLGGQSLSKTEYTYDRDGKPELVKVDGQAVADPIYSSDQRLAGVIYGNGAALGSIARDISGRTVGQTWTVPGADPVVEQLVLSRSGRVLRHQVTRGAEQVMSTFSYDAAGRLIKAVIPRHELTYGFGDAVCGATAAERDATGGLSVTAGMNGNRTSLVDVKDGDAASALTTRYCYDQADRL